MALSRASSMQVLCYREWVKTSHINKILQHIFNNNFLTRIVFYFTNLNSTITITQNIVWLNIDIINKCKHNLSLQYVIKSTTLHYAMLHYTTVTLVYYFTIYMNTGLYTNNDITDKQNYISDCNVTVCFSFMVWHFRGMDMFPYAS